MDQTTVDDLSNKLSALLAEKLAGMTPGAGQSMGGPWAGGPNLPGPTGVSIALTIPLPDGSEVPAQLNFGPEVIPNLPALVASLAQSWPIKIYPPRNQWGPSNGGWAGGGGGGGGGGGYNRRPWGRRY